MPNTDRPTLTEMADVLRIARDHLQQYRAYSEAMREIGRGCSISSAFQPDTLDSVIAGVIRRADHAQP